MSIYKPGRPSKYNPTTGVGPPPAKPGEYRIRDAGGSIAYIGENNNLARRTGEHIRSSKFSTGQTGLIPSNTKLPMDALRPILVISMNDKKLHNICHR